MQNMGAVIINIDVLEKRRLEKSARRQRWLDLAAEVQHEIRLLTEQIEVAYREHPSSYTREQPVDWYSWDMM